MNMLAIASPISLISLAAAVAGVSALYALHHLRTQPQRRAVATLVFWKQVARSEQTRVPWARRFTHRRTFAFLSAIVLLAAAALTADRWDSRTTARHDAIVIDDGEASQGSSNDMQPALAAVNAALKGSGTTPTIIAAGPQPELLARDGDPAVIARRKLSALRSRPGDTASDLALELAAAMQADQVSRIEWFTAAAKLPAGLPVEVARRVDINPLPRPASVAITGITFVPDADDSTRGSVQVTVSGAFALPFSLAAESADGSSAKQAISLKNGEAIATFAGLAADGSNLRLRILDAPGRADACDVTFGLPDQRTLTFRCAPGVPLTLRAALLACGSEAQDGVVWVGPRDMPTPDGVRAVIAVVRDGPMTPQAETLALAPSTSPLQSISFESSVARGPAVPGGGTPLLTAGLATMVSLDTTGKLPTLNISRGVLDDDSDLPRRAAFPMLVRQWCDALLGRTAAPAVVPAQRLAHDPLWPGGLASSNGPDARMLAVGDRLDRAEASPQPGANHLAVGSSIVWTNTLLAIVLVLLGIESLLLAARKIV